MCQPAQASTVGRMPDSIPCFSYKFNGESRMRVMLLKALCILAVIFVGVGLLGLAIRRRRGL